MERETKLEGCEASILSFVEENFDRVFSVNLMSARKSRRITQKELADMIGTTRNSVIQWESGIRHPDVVIIMKISLVLGVPMSRLLEENYHVREVRSFG